MCMCVCVCVWVSVCMCVCVHACMCVCDSCHQWSHMQSSHPVECICQHTTACTPGDPQSVQLGNTGSTTRTTVCLCVCVYDTEREPRSCFSAVLNQSDADQKLLVNTWIPFWSWKIFSLIRPIWGWPGIKKKFAYLHSEIFKVVRLIMWRKNNASDSNRTFLPSPSSTHTHTHTHTQTFLSNLVLIWNFLLLGRFYLF